MPHERVDFPGSQGTTLAGRLDLPAGRPRAFALFAHCFTCTKEVVAASRISRALTEYGIGVLRFDFTGLGGSDGDFANTDFTSNVADLVAAADFLRGGGRAPALLIGHSLGGAAVLAAAAEIGETRAVVTIGAPAGTEHLLHLLVERRDEIGERGEAEVCLAGRPFRIRREFLDDISSQPQLERIAALDAALLVMHSPCDETVGVDNARLIFDAARHPKAFIPLDGADHLLSRHDDAQFAATMLATWAARYLDEVPTDPPTTPPDPGAVVVAENGAGQLGQEITVGDHVLRADEPVPAGLDTGPSPYDLLLAGLGACTSMTLRLYADRKKWPLEKVTVTSRHSRIHAEDCTTCETETGHLDHIERVIDLTGTLDDEQRQRLLQIADRCPVHRTLHSEIAIDTTLTEAR